ncbi:hypothetical protein [Portibacter lacus]|uniref:Uncharacterized protein n=1 Tax=Portibacter lacus TaxID=1099794 RepID=A0AA37SP89_9BACT|nr:hypothetical protein [Portibacter lacus]GLR16674.1 hypothetical protein GCM10007940_12890 [Portibacter lacus]
MEEESQERKNIFKTWLETLQQESWQLELLISGLALFGIFEAKVLLDSLESYISIQFLRGSALLAVNIFVFLLKGSWYIFLINLLIHIVLRGLWIGAIGLRYVSQDINYDELRFSAYFKKLYTRRYESFDDYIEDLEKLCSVIFAYTFLLFFILISACLFVVWPVVFLSFLGEQIGALLALIYVLLGMIVFIDFIFLNPFKRMEDKWFSIVYGFIFRVFSTITLSFIFRPLLLNFLDNKFTRKLFLFSIPYGIIIIIILPQLSGETISYIPSFKNESLKSLAYSEHSINPYLYDDLRPEGNETINSFSMKSFHVDGSILEFFVRHIKKDENYFNEIMNYSKLNRTGINSIFRKRNSEDSVYMEMMDTMKSQIHNFIIAKKKNENNKSEQYWDNENNSLTMSQDSMRREYYADRIREINQAFEKMNKYFIDEQEVTEEVSCLLSSHSNLGEKGWNCFVNIDSLQNGVHKFRLERGLYNRTNKTISKMVLEIPFILDKN